MSENKTVSLRPTDAVQGGLLDDADVTVTGARFDFFTYSSGQSGVGAILDFEDADGKTTEQFYSAGDANKFVPSDDKTRLLITGNATGLNKSSNTYELLSSLVSSGFPEDKLADGNIGAIVGLKAHVNRKAMPKSKDSDKERSVLVVTKIHSLPGETTAKGGGKKAAGTKAAAAPAAAASSEIDAEATGVVIGLLAENGGSIERSKISQLAFQKLQAEKNPNKSKITTRVFAEDFLKSLAESGVEYDGKTIKMAA